MKYIKIGITLIIALILGLACYVYLTPTPQEQAIAELQEKGITPDTYNAVLHVYAKKGDAESVQLLIIAGADVNTQNSHGWSSLITASWHGHTAVVQALLDSPEIDVNQPSKDGHTPLHAAAKQGHTDIVKLLLSHPYINVNKANTYNQTPKDVAKTQEIKDLLLRYGNKSGQ